MDRFLLSNLVSQNLIVLITVCWLASVSGQFVSIHSTVEESGRTHACPGEHVTYTCETLGTVLTWIVEPYIQMGDNEYSFFQNSPEGDSKVDTREAIILLIATKPHIQAEMSLRPSGRLENTTVLCCASSNCAVRATQEYLLSVPPQAPSNIRSNRSDGIEFENSDGFAYVEIEWDSPSNNDDISHYFLLIYYTDNSGKRSTEERVVEDRTYYVFSVDHQAFSSVTVDVTTVNKCGQNSATSVNTTIEVNIRSIPECDSSSLSHAVIGLSVPLGILSLVVFITIIVSLFFWMYKWRSKNRKPSCVGWGCI